MTNEEIDDLFATTLSGDYNDHAPHEAVKCLHQLGDPVIFEKAAIWCESEEPLKRARGAGILCQLRAPRSADQAQSRTSPEPIFVAESFQIISGMILKESDENALSSEIFGFGHLYREDAVPLLISFANHASDEIRFAVTCSLGNFPHNTAAVEQLIRLTYDEDEDVRDWATFAVGTQSNLDSESQRNALVERLDDASPAVREEAIAGLAKRKDIRSVLPLLRLLESGSYFTHHESDFEVLVGKNAPEEGWGTEDFVDALYDSYPNLLPPREAVKPN